MVDRTAREIEHYLFLLTRLSHGAGLTCGFQVHKAFLEVSLGVVIPAILLLFSDS